MMAGHVDVELSRMEVLGHRRRVGALDRRLPCDSASIRTAAWAGLQDSMPRAALMSLHARVDDIGADGWTHPALVQVWGPRFSAFVVPAEDVGAFTLGRLPVDGAARRRADETADRLERFLAGRRMTYRAAAEGLGVDPNSLRYAAPTGRVRLHWEGAGQPEVWTVDPPAIGEQEARADLLRRYLHVFGPDTATGFCQWAGVKPRQAEVAFRALDDELTTVRTPIGVGQMLTVDVAASRPSTVAEPAPARLLPSGDSFYLQWGVGRDLLVPDARHRQDLWTSRVWPGAILVDGEIVGTWRRAGADVELVPWQALTPDRRDAVEAEAAGLPIPGDHATVRVRWTEPAR